MRHQSEGFIKIELLLNLYKTNKINVRICTYFLGVLLMNRLMEVFLMENLRKIILQALEFINELMEKAVIDLGR